VLIQVASDFHHEMSLSGNVLAVPPQIAPGVGVLALAGDVQTGTKGVDLYANSGVPVPYVHGNHEAFGYGYPSVVNEMKVHAGVGPVGVLQNDEWIYSGVRILGCCLRTDYFRFPLTREDAPDTAQNWVTDNGRNRRPRGRTFRQPYTLARQRRSLLWLNARLDEPPGGKTLVVTHHASLGMSIPPKSREHVFAAAYATNVERLVAKASHWVHGQYQ
jgi:hypothetical protein